MSTEMIYPNPPQFYGTDGATGLTSYIGGPNIGYSDGAPFVSAALPWEPFPTAKTSVPPVNKNEKMWGMTYGYFANRGEIKSAEGIESQERMYKLNNNWVCLTIVNYQDTYHSTRIYADHLATPTEGDIKEFVRAAHKRWVKVCLKPMVHSRDNVWRAHIGFPDLNMDDLNAYWGPWFESYKNFILNYAEIAQECGAEMLCIGCEMLGTEHRKYDWEYIIKEVRRVYKGKIVYNTNHDHEDDQQWFELCDYLGTSAYYPVGAEYLDGPVDNSYDSLVKRWWEIRYRLDAIAKDRGKQFIFMEVGCRSVMNASAHPWDFTESLSYDEDEQLNFYMSCMEVFKDDPYFAGVFWWDWPTFLPKKHGADFYIIDKKAEDYLQQFYGAMNNV